MLLSERPSRCDLVVHNNEDAGLGRAAPRLPEILSDCASGRELREKGWAADVGYAARLNASSTVPVLTDGAFR